MTTNDHSLVSCICLTRNKPHLLKRAIDCFCYQSYPDKELIVIYEDDDELTKAFVQNASYPANIRFNEVSFDSAMTLGQKRNFAVAMSSGDYFCSWDDDDWYHPDRILYQYQTLKNNNIAACVLTQWIVFDEITGNVYVSNRRLWEGSIMCDTETMMNTLYDEIQHGEDTPLIEKLNNQKRMFEINGKMGLYIYVYHGNNSWHRQHWENIFFHSQQLDALNSSNIKKILAGTINTGDVAHIMDGICRQVNSKV